MENNTQPSSITLRAVTIFIFGTLFYFYEYFLQVTPAVMTQPLMHDFSINATLIGTMSGFFFYSYTFMQIPSGLLLDRYGARLILTIVSVICAIGALLFGLAPDVWVASAGRFVMGGASAFAFVGVIYLLIRWFPPRFIALFIGVLQLIGCLGALFSDAPLAYMINHIGWRQSMFIFAVAGIVISIITWLVVRNEPQKSVQTVAAPQPRMLKNLKIVATKPQMWFIGFYAFGIWAPTTAFASLWGVPYLATSLHITSLHAAGILSFTWIGIAIGSPAIGWLSDSIFGRRCILLTISAVLGLFATLGLLYIPHASLWVTMSLLFLLGLAAAGQTLIFGVVKDVNHVNTTGAANGFTNMAVVCSGMLLQPFIGKLLDMNWSGVLEHGVRVYSLQDFHIALLTLPVCFFLAAIMSIFFIKETYCKQAY